MKPYAWSHSALAAFDTCPRQYEEVKVLRNFQEQNNAASLWGDEFHKAAERYIKTKCGVGEATLPANMLQYDKYLLQFVTRPGNTLAEQKFALTSRLAPCGFYDKDVWVRGIIDVLTIDGKKAKVGDHKTGKNRKKDFQQLVIFALLTFYHYPEVDEVEATFYWIQHGFGPDAEDSATFRRSEIPQLWESLLPKLQRFKAAFQNGVFPPKPSGLCKKYCVVQTCEYWGSGRR